MIIATCPIPEMIVPKSITSATTCEVNLEKAEDPPVDRADWIACGMAQPHIDDCYADSVFITLVLTNHHEVGDAQSSQPDIMIGRGDLIVIDPAVTHWLMPRWSEWGHHIELNRLPPLPNWHALQWEFDREEAAERAREIVSSLGGAWADDIDPRYAKWATTAGVRAA